MKTKNKIKLSVQEWDKLVTDTYKRPYKLQQQDGCKARGKFKITVPATAHGYQNSSVPEEVNGQQVGVSLKAWLERDPTQWGGPENKKIFLDLFWARNFYPEVQTLANDMYLKGVIEAGQYTINIDW